MCKRKIILKKNKNKNKKEKDHTGDHLVIAKVRLNGKGGVSTQHSSRYVKIHVKSQFLLII